jgi:SpoVK/Ycf46/Vps4 family AAA+-type ATPase
MTSVTVISVEMPNRTTMEQVIDSFLEFAPDKAKEHIAENDHRNKVVQAMLGLTTEAAANALSRSQAMSGVYDPLIISKEKERVVRGSGLEWYEPDPRGMEGVGGIDILKNWLTERKSAFTAEARLWGLPAPKGTVLLGVPGGGKSLTCKCIATAWSLPLLRMDIGSLFSKYVGESEGKIRQALQTAEAVAPCILWLDEIEKAMGQGGGESDGGTSQRVFGTFLTWMQERKPGVFIIATANDLRPFETNPEFLRAGRWDDIWFVDLPTTRERVHIAEIMRFKFDHCETVDSMAVSLASSGYTGAEIEGAFNDAMYNAFTDGMREVLTSDITGALAKRVPLSKTMGEKIEKLRTWAKGRARMASSPDTIESTAKRSIE